MKTYKGRTVLVTGASTGIGRAMAIDLSSRGARVIAVARSEAQLQSLAGEFARTSAGLDIIAMDLSTPDAAARLHAEVAARGLSVDVLVNNAGFGKWGGFLDETPATYDQMINLNIKTLVDLCQAFLPAMLAKGEGGIINVGSTGSFMPVPWSSVYAATKAFVLSFSEGLYYECKDRGVTVTCLCPGNTDTNFAAVAHAAASKVGQEGESPAAVAKVGLDALLKGKATVISGAGNRRMVSMMKRMSRDRALRTIGEAWKSRLASRGILF